MRHLKRHVSVTFLLQICCETLMSEECRPGWPVPASVGQEQASAWSVNIADIGTDRWDTNIMLHLLQTIHRIASHPGQARPGCWPPQVRLMEPRARNWSQGQERGRPLCPALARHIWSEAIPALMNLSRSRSKMKKKPNRSLLLDTRLLEFHPSGFLRVLTDCLKVYCLSRFWKVINASDYMCGHKLPSETRDQGRDQSCRCQDPSFCSCLIPE